MHADSKKLATTYELLAIFAGSLRDAEAKKEIEKWEAEVAKLGKILNKAVWENRALAYKIKQETQGNYLIIHFEGDGNKIQELDNALRLDPKVIRSLIYKTPKHYEWKDYGSEDLEHDFTKLEPQVDTDHAHKKIVKKTVPKAVPRIKKSEDKKATETVVAPKKEKVEEEIPQDLDSKLDDILSDL